MDVLWRKSELRNRDFYISARIIDSPGKCHDWTVLAVLLVSQGVILWVTEVCDAELGCVRTQWRARHERVSVKHRLWATVLGLLFKFARKILPRLTIKGCERGVTRGDSVEVGVMCDCIALIIRTVLLFHGMCGWRQNKRTNWRQFLVMLFDKLGGELVGVKNSEHGARTL